jgi:hypothetical protein
MTDVDTVERVAKAMAASHTLDWDEIPSRRRYRFRNYARAAIAALPPAAPATTPDPAESHVDGWRVRVIEWATDETVKVVQCKGEREAEKIERGMSMNMASEYYTEVDNKPRTITTTPDPVAEAKGAADIAAERQRQIDVEGWTPAHDDEHKTGELAKAASCYAWAAGQSDSLREAFADPPPTWPSQWGVMWWKPKDRRADLVRAGALIAAEIDRLDRCALTKDGEAG